MPDTLEDTEWLLEMLPANARIGVDPKLVDIGTFF